MQSFDDNTKTSENGIAGVVVRTLIPHEDERGVFTEIFVKETDTGIVPSQWSIVRSMPGVFRGFHLHLRHDEYFSVVQGRALVGLYDLRPGSPTFRKSALLDLPANPPRSLIFPTGLLHGWYFPEATIHAQAVSESYINYGEHDNFGCRYDDPALRIDWPEEPVLISDRALNFPSLGDLESQLKDAGLWDQLG